MAPKADPKAKAKADAKSKAAKKVEEEEKTKVVQPDKDAFDNEVEKINAEIERMKKKKEAVQEKIYEKTGGKDAFQAKKEEIKAQIDEICSKMDELHGKKSGLEQDFSGQQARQKELRSELNKEWKSLGFSSEEEIDQRIAEIDNLLQTTSMPLKEEKKLVQEIQTLKKNRPKVAGVHRKEADLNAGFDGPSRETVKAQKATINEELAHYKEARSKLFAQREELTKQRNDQMGNVKDLFDERDALNAQIGEKVKERNTLRDDFREKEKEYRDYQNEQRRARAAKAAEEREARQQEYELKKKQQAVEKLDEQPHVAEITLIEQTMKFCRSLVAPKGEQKQEEKKEVVHNNPEGSEVLRSKGDRDEEFYFAPTKGKKSKNKNKGGGEGSSKSIKHNAETFRLFDQLKLDAPLNTDQVPALLEKLEEQLEGFNQKVKEWEQNKEAKKKEILDGLADLEAKKEKLEAEAEKEEEAKTEE